MPALPAVCAGERAGRCYEKRWSGAGSNHRPSAFQASRGEPSRSKDLWGFCGARHGTDGHGACAGCGELRQSSRNPTAIKAGHESPRKASVEACCSLSADWRFGSADLSVSRARGRTQIVEFCGRRADDLHCGVRAGLRVLVPRELHRSAFLHCPLAGFSQLADHDSRQPELPARPQWWHALWKHPPRLDRDRFSLAACGLFGQAERCCQELSSMPG